MVLHLFSKHPNLNKPEPKKGFLFFVKMTRKSEIKIYKVRFSVAEKDAGAHQPEGQDIPFGFIFSPPRGHLKKRSV